MQLVATIPASSKPWVSSWTSWRPHPDSSRLFYFKYRRIQSRTHASTILHYRFPSPTPPTSHPTGHSPSLTTCVTLASPNDYFHLLTVKTRVRGFRRLCKIFPPTCEEKPREASLPIPPKIPVTKWVMWNHETYEKNKVMREG